MSIKIETVATENFTMNYFRFGEGKKTMVILPGLSLQSVMGSAAFIQKDYSLFEKDFTVYVFDRRNELFEGYSLYDMARDSAEAIKALGLNKVCLFGTSQGGMISMIIALEEPELVEKLSLGATAADIDEGGFKVINEWVRLAEEVNAEGLYLSLGKYIYPNEFFNKHKNAFLLLAKSVTKEELERFKILASAIKGFNLDKLENIKCPVLAMGDSEDSVLGGDSVKRLEKAFAKSKSFESYTFSGYGHAVYDLAPDFKQRLYDFFTK